MDPAPAPAWLSEEDVIALMGRLAGAGGAAGPGLERGIGDDAAVLRLGPDRYVVTTDLLVEGVHFAPSFTDPYTIGRRAMAANLSDLAAMGARPRWGFLSLGLAGRPQGDFVEALARGVIDLGREYGLVLAGGDTVRSPQTILNLCLIGAMEGLEPPLRSSARAGQAVCVTGWLGQAAGGLAWLLGGGAADDPLASPLAQAHLRPTPRLGAGRALAQTGRLGAMMDLSDGLASDLNRLGLASGVGAEVEAALMPVSPAARELAARLGADPLDWALKGGEDFELLFTCAQGDVAALAQAAAQAEPGLMVTQVGVTQAEPGLWLKYDDGRRANIAQQGFDHFREGSSS